MVGTFFFEISKFIGVGVNIFKKAVVETVGVIFSSVIV